MSPSFDFRSHHSVTLSWMAAALCFCSGGWLRALDYEPQATTPGAWGATSGRYDPYAQQSQNTFPGSGKSAASIQNPKSKGTPSGYSSTTKPPSWKAGSSPYATNIPPAQPPPAVQPMPQQYAPLVGGFNTQPVPYPEIASPQPKPQPPVGQSAITADVEALKHNDRLQDQRLANLESMSGAVARHSVQPPKPKAQSQSPGAHRVMLGETMATIAQSYGMSVDELKLMNHRRSNVVMPGEMLLVPSRSSSLSSSRQSTSSTALEDSSFHTVQKGETLSQIASRYHVSLGRLQAANKLRNPNVITPGQRIAIPSRASGSTNGSLATHSKPKQAASGTTKQPALTASASTSKTKASAGTPVVMAPAQSVPKSIVSYRIEGTEDINAVAKLFRTTPSEIQRLNKLPAAKLPPAGEEIIVPSPGLVSL